MPFVDAALDVICDVTAAMFSAQERAEVNCSLIVANRVLDGDSFQKQVPFVNPISEGQRLGYNREYVDDVQATFCDDETDYAITFWLYGT